MSLAARGTGSSRNANLAWRPNQQRRNIFLRQFITALKTQNREYTAMHIALFSCATALTLGLLAGAAPAQAASTYATLFARAGSGAADSRSGNNGETISLSVRDGSISNVGGTSDASATVSASIGKLKAATRATGKTVGATRNFAGGQAYADARWFDNITIVGGPTGTRGSLTALLAISGSSLDTRLAGNRNDSASVNMAFTLTTFFRTGFNIVANNATGTFIDPPKSLLLNIGFIFGSPTPIGFQLTTFVRSNASTEWFGSGAFADSGLDYGNTVAWDGITGVFNQTGAPITNYSVLSESGFDYTQSAVPEPATWAMLIAGFGLVGGMQRQRRVGLISAGKA
jgi:hypothetical protein